MQHKLHSLHHICNLACNPDMTVTVNWRRNLQFIRCASVFSTSLPLLSLKPCSDTHKNKLCRASPKELLHVPQQWFQITTADFTSPTLIHPGEGQVSLHDRAWHKALALKSSGLSGGKPLAMIRAPGH